MKGEHFIALQRQILAEVVEQPLMQRMGLKDGDLYGAAVAATASLRSGDFDKALNAFAHLLLLDPVNPDFHAGLAEAALGVNDYAIALQSASVVVAANPSAPDGYFLSARACIGLKEPALALEDLAEAERLALKSGAAAIIDATRKLRALIRDAEPAAQ
ncbi:hypothetical protein C0V75_18035 [Tabrizicola sp. TH137]|uniref:tetratricopeptide repeat protein n=1 Tax=Tabrizicola sp. TH137 TaxID=2067452 RepID=UPI000C7AEE41|nr:tetratricopeptide repeat protein [Tabrizicola sp. TH137]PLL11180.1 hypothetical protein C0V75_18035 [Tabrizicola sp. TH137]